jgi:Putative zinc-finger
MTHWTWLTAKVQEWLTKARRRSPTEGSSTMLRCRDVVDLILVYLEDALDPTERQAFEAHIADCMNCWQFLKSYRETVALGQQLREEVIPADVRERLEEFLRSRVLGTS